MSLKDELLECIAIRDRLERQVGIAGIITEALKPLGITPIVVGGTAVEFYTLGQYATLDNKKAHEYDCADKFEEIQRSAKKIKKQMGEQRK